MRKFAVGNLFFFASIYGWNVAWWIRYRPWADASEWAGFLMAVVPVCLLPVACAYLVANLMDYRSPRDIFDARAKRIIAPILLGALSGCLGVALASAAFVFFDAWHGHDAMILGSSSAASTFMVVALARKRRAGRCIRCGYDISHSLDFGRCPECGTAISTR